MGNISSGRQCAVNDALYEIMDYPTIENDRGTIITKAKPWEFCPNVPANLLGDKPNYLKWRGNKDTKHMLFFAAEGVSADVRVNKNTNPVRSLFAIVADYDFAITADMEANIKKAAIKPTWMSHTFSGGRRLVWEFEGPVPFDTQIQKAFYDVVLEELSVDKLLPGLDVDSSWGKATRGFDVGHTWTRYSDDVISTNIVSGWLLNAVKRVGFHTGETNIPLDTVKAEIDKRWPNVWSGDFVVNARGPVFWEGRHNPSSAVVMENGMFAFSSHKMFHSWRDILGAQWTDQFVQDKIGSAIANVYYDSQHYWRKFNDNAWMPCNRDEMAIWLVQNRNLMGKPDDRGKSEMKSALDFVHNERRIDGVSPSLFDSRETFEFMGRRLLNIARSRALQPATETGKWGENFPWIGEFLTTGFGDEQLAYYIAWAKRFYGSALAGDLQQGQSIFIVGDVNAGKTLMATHIIAPLVGGFGDASDYISEGKEFNKALVHKALWLIDDASIAINQQVREKFGERIKRLVANPTMVYRQMYQDGELTRWIGRLLILLNADAHSIKLIPDLSASLEDKIMIFRMGQPSKPYPPNHILEPIIAAELPHLARYLVDMETPAHVVRNDRFGVVGYIDKDTRSQALFSSGVGGALEIIDLWFKRSSEDPDATWQGTITEWFFQAQSDPDLRPMLSKYNTVTMGKRFAEASTMDDTGISITNKNGRHGTIYLIKRQRE